ncbi:MAG: hypothetical protein ACYC7M_07700, partial [Bellilinea sp.]
MAEKGLEAVPELMRVLINNAMQVERSKYLQAEEYERTEDRKGHAISPVNLELCPIPARFSRHSFRR